MEFKKYMSLKRVNGVEKDLMLKGMCYIFPKLDGTNASVWLGDIGNVQAGSRNRLLSSESKEADNAGFCSWVLTQDNIKQLLIENKNLRLYGEWLVPHTIREYLDTAWNNFYIFDVYNELENRWLSFYEYEPLLIKYNLKYIKPVTILENPSEDKLLEIA